MNVFHHYSQKGALPIENNISRGLAILLDEYPLLLFMFIDLVRNESLKNLVDESERYIEIPYPESEYKIVFQKQTKECSDFEPNRIIGIALTTKNHSDSYCDQDIIIDEDYPPISDISIEFDDTIILIEVKRSGENCIDQLNGQIRNYINSLLKNNREKDTDPDVSIVSITWTDIIKTLEKYKKMEGYRVDRLLEDYYSHLLLFYPSWFPTEPLSKLSFEDDKVRIGKRLDVIKTECARNRNNSLLENRHSIPLNVNYASECAVYTDEIYTHNNIYEKCLIVSAWPSDTCGQFWALRTIDPELRFAGKRYRDIRLAGFDDLFHVRVLPYLKFSHFNRGLFNIYLDEKDDNNHIKELNNLAYNNIGKWKKEDDWVRCIDSIRKSGVLSEQKFTNLEKYFYERIDSSNRQYFVMSVGFEVSLYIPFERAKTIDSDLDTGLVTLINTYIKDYIESIDNFVKD